MTISNRISSLDGRRLAMLTYVSRYGEGQIINASNLYKSFPFTKHLFSTETKDVEDILASLAHDNLLITHDDKSGKYERLPELDSREVWQKARPKLIDIDKSFVRNRILEIIKDINLHDFIELEQFYVDQNLRDPFLSAFSEDLRVGHWGWWQTVCKLANLYEGIIRHETVSELVSVFAQTANLRLDVKEDETNRAELMDRQWSNQGIVELKAFVDNITPWKKEIAIQIILVRWRNISLERRDEIKSDTLKALLKDATIAHMILPIGNPDKRDEEILKSTQLIIFTPEDSKEIFINKKPANRFRELLRGRMDIELLSPYQTTGSVPDTMFFGRDYEIRLIAANPETSYAIYGGRQSGKTSLMMKLKRLYEGKCPVAFVDCELVSTEEDFIVRLCRSLDMEAMGSYNEFFVAAGNIKPRTLLLIDELDPVVESCSPKRIIGILRYLNEQYHIRCILSGSTELYKQFRDVNSPMYNFANPLMLGSFKEEEAINLAKDPMRGLDVVYAQMDSTIKQLINLCGRFPNLIQLMCHEMVKNTKTKETRTITSEMLTEVYESEAFGGYVEQLFNHNFNACQKLIVYVALMAKSMPLNAIVGKVQGYYNLTMSQVEDLLEDLVLLFVLRRRGNIYYWAYDGFPRLLKKRFKNLDFRIRQAINEAERETLREPV